MINKFRQFRQTLDSDIFIGERYKRNIKECSVMATIYMLIGLVMFAVNILHGEYKLSVFSLLAFITGALTFYFSVIRKSRKGIIAVVTPSYILVFTFLILFSTNKFAYHWIFLVPITVCYLLSIKIGIYLTLYFEVFLIVLFYTPLRKFVAPYYLDVVMGRFPILFFFVGMVTIFIMYSYHKSVLFEIRHTQEALELSEAKTNFLASMSHEIRTPINAILGMNEMILRENMDPVIGEYSDSVKKSGQMLLMLVNDVLDFSKIEAGKMEIHEASFTMAQLLFDIMPMLQERAGEKSLTFKVTITNEVPNGILSDEFRIKQILINLINNAIKYTDEGSVHLLIGGKYTGDDTYSLSMSVKDTGRGISEEAQKHLFEAFARADLGENRNIEGTGLGLAIVKSILDSMGGHIRVDSRLKEGSEFVVDLPVKVEDKTPLEEDYEKQVKVIATDRKESDYRADDAKVLAVDDNSANLKIVSLFLKRVGIVPDTCNSGSKAIERCKEKKYDLILLDHRMPDPDGIETLSIIRSDEGSLNKETPALVLTANALVGSEKIYKDAGFADYLTKPLDSSLLERTVKRYLPEDKIITEDYASDIDDHAEIIEFMPANADAGAVDDSIPGVMVFDAHPDSDAVKGADTSDLRKKLEQIEGLDYDTALSHAGGYEELLRETISIIASECDEKIERMQSAVSSGDYKGYELVAHSIKGLMATIGLSELSARAKKHEFAAADNDVSFIWSDSEEFLKEYRKVCTKLKQI